VTFSAALFVLVLALIRGNEEGWASPPIVAMLVAAGLLLALFLVAERRQARPMFDLELFRKKTFSGVSIAAFVLSASMFAMFLYITLYVQTILGYGPLDTGLRFLPLTVLSFFAAAAAGKLTARLPARAMLCAGLTLVGCGLLLMHGLDADSQWTALLPGFIVAGLGIGLTNPSLANAAIGVVTPARSGMASGINSTFRQVGIATGIAGLGAIFESQVAHRLTDTLAGTPSAGRADALAHAISAGGAPQVIAAAPAAARPRLHEAIAAAFSGGLDDLFLVAAVVAFAGAALALALVRRSDFVAPGGPPSTPPAPATGPPPPDPVTA
jgi:predicted MFS family arabinose efflux permease